MRCAFVAFRLLVAIAALAACSSDKAQAPQITPARSDTLRLAMSILGIPRPDSIVDQLGLLVAVQGFTGLESYTWTIDSYTWTIDSKALAWHLEKPPLVLATPFLRSGTHTARVVVSPTNPAIATFDTTFTFTTRVDSRRYQMTVLPALAGNVNAIGEDMNESGVVVGASGGTAVRWQAGQVHALGSSVSDSVPNVFAIAFGVNPGGDVVGEVRNGQQDFAVLWSPGVPMRIIARDTRAFRINSARQVLLGYAQAIPSDVTLFDIPSGTATVLWKSAFARGLNAHGQAVGQSESYFEGGALGFGVSLAPLPLTQVPTVAGGGRYEDEALDINDAGEVLAEYGIGDHKFWCLIQPSNSILLTPYLASPQRIRMNNHGVVAALELDSAIYTWNETSHVVERVGTDPAWQFDDIAHVTDTGIILAHGRNIITGKQGPVLLSPLP